MKTVVLGLICVLIGSSSFAGVETLPKETVAKLQDSLAVYAKDLGAEAYDSYEAHAVYFSRNEPFVQIGPNTYKTIATFKYVNDDGESQGEKSFELVLDCSNPYRSCRVE